MNCSDVQNLLSAYYDNELSADSWQAVDVHLKQCQACSNEIKEFKSISALASELQDTEVTPPAWTAVTHPESEMIEPVELPKPTPKLSPESTRASFRPLRTVAVSLVVFVCLFGFYLYWSSPDEHDHFEMQVAMESVVAQIESDKVSNLLLNQFGGSEISAADAYQHVGYNPLVTTGLPDGYNVASVQVLTMPCCTCIQTICKRRDDSKLFIYEHSEEDTGWFENRPSEQITVDGEVFEVIKIGELMVATCKKNNRHVTYLGLQSAEELTQMARQYRG